MTPYRPPSIRDMGLQTYLDNSKSQHDGLGYAEFVKYVGKELNITDLAKLFNVHRHTMGNWLGVFDEEQQNSEKDTD